MAAYIVLDPVDGTTRFETAEEAEAHAQSLIEVSLIDGQWTEDVERIEWGEYVRRAQATECNPRDSTHGCDYDCDYELRPTREQSDMEKMTAERDLYRKALCCETCGGGGRDFFSDQECPSCREAREKARNG